LYDFSAIYFTWLVATKEINQRVDQAKQELASSSGELALDSLLVQLNECNIIREGNEHREGGKRQPF